MLIGLKLGVADAWLNMLMRLDELFGALPNDGGVCFLGSAFRLEGAVRRVDLKMTMHPRYYAVEKIMEKMRPELCPARAGSIVMAETVDTVRRLGMPTRFVYQVQPVGRTWRFHSGWWHMIRDAALPREREIADTWAANYWSGSECHFGHPWERRAEAVRILGPVL